MSGIEAAVAPMEKDKKPEPKEEVKDLSYHIKEMEGILKGEIDQLPAAYKKTATKIIELILKGDTKKSEKLLNYKIGGKNIISEEIAKSIKDFTLDYKKGHGEELKQALQVPKTEVQEIPTPEGVGIEEEKTQQEREVKVIPISPKKAKVGEVVVTQAKKDTETGDERVKEVVEEKPKLVVVEKLKQEPKQEPRENALDRLKKELGVGMQFFDTALNHSWTIDKIEGDEIILLNRVVMKRMPLSYKQLERGFEGEKPRFVFAAKEDV